MLADFGKESILITKSKEFLDEFAVRKSRKQKTTFIQRLCSEAANIGYVNNIDQTKSGARNVIVGNFNDSSVVFVTHYDTPSRSCFPHVVCPKMPWISAVLKILSVLAVFLPTFGILVGLKALLSAVGLAENLSLLFAVVASVISYVVLLLLFVGGVAKKNNANVSSGVLALLEIMRQMPKELRSEVSFVFFDEHENGGMGASDFEKENRNVLVKKLVVGIDSVGLGKDFVVTVSPNAEPYLKNVEDAFGPYNQIRTTVLHGGKHFYSDHSKFKNSIGVSSFKKTDGGLLYRSESYSESDTECNEENINYLAISAVNIAKTVKNRTVENDAEE